MAIPIWYPATRILHLNGDTTWEEIYSIINDPLYCSKVQSGDITIYNLNFERIINDGDTVISASKEVYVNITLAITVENVYGELTNHKDKTLTIKADPDFKNIVFVLPRISINNWQQIYGAMINYGTWIFENCKFYTASPVNEYTSQAAQYISCELYPLDRSSGAVGAPAQIRTSGITSLRNTILGMSGNIYQAVADTLGFVLKNIGLNTPALLLHALNRGGTSEEFVFDGFDTDGTGSLIMAASARALLRDTPKGTSLPIDWQFQQLCGVCRFTQRVQFTVLDAITLEPVEHARVSTVDYDDDIRPTSGYYANQFSYSGISTLVQYLFDMLDDRRYTSKTDANGQTVVMDMLIGAFWNNDPTLPNTRANLANGRQDCILTEDDIENRHPWYCREYGYVLSTKQTVMRAEGVIKQDIIYILPDLNVTKTRDQVANMTRIETYSDLYDALKYNMAENDDWGFLNRYTKNPFILENGIIKFNPLYNGKLIAEDNAEPIQYDAVTNTFNIYIGPNGILSSDDHITVLEFQADLTIPNGSRIDGIYEYVRANTTFRSHYMTSIPSFNDNIKYLIELLQINADTSEQLLEKYNAPNDIPAYFELQVGLGLRIHTHGGGVSDNDISFADVPDLLEVTPSLDGEAGLVEAIQAKLDDGRYVSAITKNNNIYTLNLGGTESMNGINSNALYILADHAVSKYNEGKPSGERITTSQIILNGSIITVYAVLGTLNDIFFNDGPGTRIILNDANEAYLNRDFGINAQTSTKMRIGYIGLKSGDTYKRGDNGYVTVQADGDYYEVVLIADNNLALVKRDWVKILQHTFSINAPLYIPVVSEVWNAEPSNVVNKYEPISEYLEIVNNELLHKKSTVDPEVDKAVTANPYHIRLLNDFDKTFPNGINGAHIIHKLRDTQIVLNYKPVVPDVNVYYDSAGITNGHETNGKTLYESYLIKNIGGNSETFELHLHRLLGAGSYNDAAVILHELFKEFGYQHPHTFLVERSNGQIAEITAFVNAKHSTVWDFNWSLPNFALQENETITFFKESIDPNLVYVAMQLAYSAAEIVATGYITPLLQDSITVVTGDDVKEQLGRIEADTQESITREDPDIEIYKDADGKQFVRKKIKGTENVISTKEGVVDETNSSVGFSGGAKEV